MSEATWRAYLKTVLESVPNVGLVHDYERWAALRSDFIALFKTTIGGIDVVRGWTIACSGFASSDLQHDPEVAASTVVRAHTFKIRGFFSLDDSAATEKSSWAIVTLVSNALDKSDLIHDEDASYGSPPGCSVDVAEPRKFGDVLVHYFELTQEVREMECIK